ncbi:hypothetical protein AB0H43_01280 [Hamadaea sp. NPDC050747]|uniref:hypothetical protein n=1 Tax=Hamadaea sp. NPDC050747 TaxID=3155789 RepID=UPI0033F6B6DD
MRFSRTLLAGALVTATAVLGTPASVAAAAPYTVFVVDLGQNGGWPVEKSGVYDGATVHTTVSGEGFGIWATDPVTGEGFGSLSAQPPTDQTWTEGQTYPAARFADSTHALLDMSSNGHGCNQSGGSITVRQVTRDADTHNLTSFAATYSFDCELSGQPITGEVRWNSSIGYVAASTNTSNLDFGTRDIGSTGTTLPYTVTAKGSDPVVLGTAALGGTGATSFKIVTDGCSGTTLQPGASCTVTIGTTPLKQYQQSATLTLPDNTALGHRQTNLTVNGRIGAAGTYYALSPTRILDTRTGNGAAKAPLGPGKVINLQVTGRGGVPATGVGSVVLNVTVTGPTANSYLTVYPTGVARPTASSVNFAKGWLGSNSVTVKVGTGGKVTIYNNSGYTHVVVDVSGYYAANNDPLASTGHIGGQYQPTTPKRIFDTRSAGGMLPAGYYLPLWVGYVNRSLNTHITAVVLNITAVTPTRAGFLTAWDSNSSLPNASTVNYAAGKVVPNLAVVPTYTCWDCVSDGSVAGFGVYTSQNTHVVVDLVGIIDDGSLSDGLRFTPMAPTRIADSRIGQGTPRALGANSVAKITTPDAVAPNTTEALALNVTGILPTLNTVLTVWSADMSRPGVSNLNPAKGTIVSNAAITLVDANQAFNVHNLQGTINLVVDVVGTYYLYPGTASATVAGVQGVTGNGSTGATTVGGAPARPLTN